MGFKWWSQPKVVEPTFFVFGALKANLGKYSDSERFDQTRETFRSIRALFPNSELNYIDAGLSSPSLERLLWDLSRGILGNQVKTLNLTQDSEIQQIHRMIDSELGNFSNRPALEGYYKSRLEAVATFKSFKNKAKHQMGPIFKISARYSLNNNFRRNYQKWMRKGTDWDFLVKKPRPSYLKPKVEGFENYCPTMLWGCRNISPAELSVLFVQVDETLQDLKRNGSIVDLEHAFWKGLNSYRVMGVRRLLTSGFVASSGTQQRF